MSGTPINVPIGLNTPRAISDLGGPGVANYDFAVFKTTQVNERFGLQFRTEVFNLFNRAQFRIPNSTVGVAQFGVISACRRTIRGWCSWR